MNTPLTAEQQTFILFMIFFVFTFLMHFHRHIVSIIKWTALLISCYAVLFSVLDAVVQ
jgi:hypothetical protein